MLNHGVIMEVFYAFNMASLLSNKTRKLRLYNGGKIYMGKCPKCGTEVAKPKKSWKMAGRPDKQGKRMQLEIGLFECPNCGATFREVLSKKKI